MNNQSYHHGRLKEELIDQGIKLLNREGYENFSLRKLAKLCGVSHAAPYKHFKNIDELIEAITQKVLTDFSSTLFSAIEKYSTDYALQLHKMGKKYVQFMVENPEYLKFLFINRNTPPVSIKDSSFVDANSNDPFSIFARTASNFFDSIDSIDSNPDSKVTYILTMWSLVHGISELIINNSIVLEGDYMEYVDKMLLNSIFYKLKNQE